MVSRLYRLLLRLRPSTLKHLEIMNGIGSTLDNLKEVAKGEHYEFTDMYLASSLKLNRKQQKARLASYGQRSRKGASSAVSKALQAVEQSQDYPAEGFVALSGLRLCS